MNTYTTKIKGTDNRNIDRNKRNVLIIGKSNNLNKNKIIINPINPTIAKKIYESGPLLTAYNAAYSITNDDNIYTVNCQLYTDFIELIDNIVQYDFDFIVPIDIYLRDTFIHPFTGVKTNLMTYYLERLKLT